VIRPVTNILDDVPGAHCEVIGCRNGYRQLDAWKSKIWPLHDCYNGVCHCTSDPPFILFNFQTEAKDSDKCREWLKMLNYLCILRQ